MHREPHCRSIYSFLFVLLSALTVAMLFLSTFIGSSNLSFGAIFSAIVSPADGGSASEILWKIRILPCISLLIIGRRIGTFRILAPNLSLHNPTLPGPFVLGVSSGAKLAVAFSDDCHLPLGSCSRFAVLDCGVPLWAPCYPWDLFCWCATCPFSECPSWWFAV